MKRLYHTTTADRIDSIMRDGFRDYATQIRQLSTTYSPSRVWFGDMPPIDHYLFDGQLWWHAHDTAEQQKFVAIDVRLPVRGIKSSANARDAVEIVNADGTVDGIIRDHIETWPCTQYWGPAAIWNKFPRTLLKLDDAIRLRIAAEPRLIGKLKTRVMMADLYLTDFQALVRKILVEDFQVKGLIQRRPSYLDQPTSGKPSLPRPQFREPPRTKSWLKNCD